MLTETEIQQVFEENKENLKKYKSTFFLQQVWNLACKLFAESDYFKSERETFGVEKVPTVIFAINANSLAKFDEFSPDFFKVLDIGLLRTEFIRRMLEICLKDSSFNKCGFKELDVQLILGIIDISRVFQLYFLKWLKSVRANPVSDYMDKLTSQEIEQKVLPKEFFNHYTVIHKKFEDKFEKFSNTEVESADELTQSAYGSFFQEELGKVCEELEKMIQRLKKVRENEKDEQDAQEEDVFIRYFGHMIKCYQETDIDKLEDTWKDLDRIWMDSKYWIQIVHDIEFGYVDSLRTKVIPDLCIRLQNKSYVKENEFIENTVKRIIVDYFENDPKRKGKPLATKNLENVKKSNCYIIFCPFYFGDSLTARISGESIPNYSDVKAEKGEKVYLDPETFASKFVEFRKTFEIVFAKEDIDEMMSFLSVEDYVFVDVAAHELGHCIYNLEDLGDELPVILRATLEEPRADLQALFVLGELRKILPKERIQRILVCLALANTRRFITYHLASFKAYLTSAIGFFDVLERNGFAKIENNQNLKFELGNFDAIDKVLDEFRSIFENILDAEDEIDSKKLEKIEKNMKIEGNIAQFLAKKLAR